MLPSPTGDKHIRVDDAADAGTHFSERKRQIQIDPGHWEKQMVHIPTIKGPLLTLEPSLLASLVL